MPELLKVFLGLYEKRKKRERREADKKAASSSLETHQRIKKKYTPKVFSALKTRVPQQAKKRFGVYQKACFQEKRREIHIHQRASKVFVGDPFAQYWCIDFGLLSEENQRKFL